MAGEKQTDDNQSPLKVLPDFFPVLAPLFFAQQYEFGAPTIDMTIFKDKGNFFRMGRPPIQIDIITDATGIDMKSSYLRRQIVEVDGLEISVISKEDLIVNKKASGRHRDLDDAEILEKSEKDKKKKTKKTKKRAG